VLDLRLGQMTRTERPDGSSLSTLEDGKRACITPTLYPLTLGSVAGFTRVDDQTGKVIRETFPGAA